jgi:hypothetical protein
MGRIENTNKYPFDTDVEITDYVIGTNNIGAKKRTRNYMILDLFRAFEAYSGLTYMTLNDIESLTYDYYGGIYGQDGGWVLFRYLKTDLNQKVQATVGLNPTKANLAAAWADRDTLNYV